MGGGGKLKEQDQIAVRNKFAALENLEDSGASTAHGTLLERTSEFWPNRVLVVVN
jgi:hypothetical protein